MRYDMDVTRDDASAFGPASLAEGALLPYEGRTLMTRPDGLPAGALEAAEDGWLSPSNPILVRGEARILPLAWRGGEGAGHGAGVTPEEISAFASQMQAAGMHWAGNWRVLDLAADRSDSIGSYTEALRSAGATRADCWTYSDRTGIALVWSGAEEEAPVSLALHVVPSAWVSEPRATKAVRGIDLRWSWADVVRLYSERSHASTTGTAGSLTQANEEGRG